MVVLCLMMASMMGLPAMAADPSIIIQSTTSTKNSGLYDYILPIYERDTGLSVRVVAVGTGQAINNARNCDGDVLVVHSKADEEQFVRDGFGISRRDVMYNDFVVIGPAADPAGLAQASTINDAMMRIAVSRASFISRGDNSGTHKAEIRLWQKAGVDPLSGSGQWYLETGQGMGGSLNLAVEMGGYILSDRSTWLAFGNRGQHDIVFEGDDRLFNQYGVIVINPNQCPAMHLDQARRFADWLVSSSGQDAINAYTVKGQQLFFANAR